MGLSEFSTITKWDFDNTRWVFVLSLGVKKLSLGLTPFYTTSCINFEIQSEILFLLRFSIIIDYRRLPILNFPFLDFNYPNNRLKNIKLNLISLFGVWDFSPLFFGCSNNFLLSKGSFAFTPHHSPPHNSLNLSLWALNFYWFR